MYADQPATRRHLHWWMLREGHLEYLSQVRITEYDPRVDHYLTPEILKRSCPVPFGLRIRPSEVIAHSAEELVAMQRHRASVGPTFMMFHLDCLANEAKIAALLEVARELA